jgi:hypothetical protein
MFIKDVGDLGDVLPGADKTLEDLTMIFDGLTLSISFKFRNRQKEILIPAANIIFMESEPHLKVISAAKVATK